MEDDLTKQKQKIFSGFLSNLGANLSWGWLKSLRFIFVFSIKSCKIQRDFLVNLGKTVNCFSLDSSEVLVLPFRITAGTQWPQRKPSFSLSLLFFSSQKDLAQDSEILHPALKIKYKQLSNTKHEQYQLFQSNAIPIQYPGTSIAIIVAFFLD